ncbi:hypothetical protein FE781_17000 [Paenibacillus thermoaerophilus]|nr:hypothetical protein FE781_17000 [Paenibacillus thermoaerophilus]
MMHQEFEKRLISQEDRPTMTVFAGVNGAGKSTLTKILAHNNKDFLIIDADAIARRLNPSDPAKANVAAGRQTIRLVNDCITKGKNFTIETTLSGGNALRQMKAAREQGFHINLYFLGLDSVYLHIERVAQRVATGGHDIPEDLIRQRYKTSLENLPKAMQLSDNVYLIDNTDVYTIKLEKKHGQIRFQAPELPEWVRRAGADLFRQQIQDNY